MHKNKKSLDIKQNQLNYEQDWRQRTNSNIYSRGDKIIEIYMGLLQINKKLAVTHRNKWTRK